jgi:internalin A
MDYDKSKEAILNQIPTDSVYDTETLEIRSTRGISTFEPLKDFKKLKYLRFGTTDSSMTIATLYGIEAASHLESLTFMSKTKINHCFESIAKLPELARLGLYNVTMAIPDSCLKDMDSLKTLSLSSSNYVSVKYLPKNIEELCLNFDSITDVPDWNTTESLKTLSVGGQYSNMTSLNSLSVFPNLETLVLNSPKYLVDISQIAHLLHLKELNLNHATAVSDFSSIAHHPSLEILRLRNTKIKDINEILPLPKLKRLFIEKSDIACLENIEKGLPELEVLWMWRTKVKNLNHLAHMHALKELNISDQHYGDWQFIATLPKLEKIDLYNSSFTDFSLLQGLPCLNCIRYTDDTVAIPGNLQPKIVKAGWDY